MFLGALCQGVFFPGSPVSSTKKTDRHNITVILLKVALTTITLNPEYNDWIIWVIKHTEISVFNGSHEH
jgi:hypothetical protein